MSSSTPADHGTLTGPWSSAFWVQVPFPLRSKSNFRRGRQAEGRQWSSLRSFETALATLATAARPSSWDEGDASLPVGQRPAVLVCIVARSLIDTANFSKSVLDACEGVLFATDASVLGVSSLGIRARSDQECVVGFAQVDGAASLDDLTRALNALTSQTAAQAEALLA